MKNLLTVTALLELAAGIGALLVPSLAVEILLGTPLEPAAARLVARVTGAALISLGLVCWSTRSEPRGRTARDVALAMTFYNVSVTGLLTYAGLVGGLSGIGLGPAVLLHIGMTVWCVRALSQIRAAGGSSGT